MAKKTRIRVTIQKELTGSADLLALDGGGPQPAELRVGRQAEPPVGVLVAGPGHVEVLHALVGRQERRPPAGQDVDTEPHREDHGRGGRVLSPEQEGQPEVDGAAEAGPPARGAPLIPEGAHDPGDTVGCQQERDEGQQPADDHDGPREEQEPAQDQQDPGEVGRPCRCPRGCAEAPGDGDGAGDHHEAQERDGPPAGAQRRHDGDQAERHQERAVRALGEGAGPPRRRLGAGRAPHDESRSKMFRVMRSTNRSRLLRP